MLLGQSDELFRGLGLRRGLQLLLRTHNSSSALLTGNVGPHLMSSSARLCSWWRGRRVARGSASGAASRSPSVNRYVCSSSWTATATWSSAPTPSAGRSNHAGLGRVRGPHRQGHRPGPAALTGPLSQYRMVPRRGDRHRPVRLDQAVDPGGVTWPKPNPAPCDASSCTSAPRSCAAGAAVTRRSPPPGPGPMSSRLSTWG
jgi:hypothetical protein